MRQLITFAFICMGLLLMAKGVKINVKEEIKPYTIKVEKVEFDKGKALIFCKIKQQQRFSYSIEFADCAVITSSNPSGIKGELVHWNDDKKIPFTCKPISDAKNESFVLSFPEESIPMTGIFDLKIGTVLNKDKKDLIIRNLSIDKNK